ncbi:hypothetical protein B0H16DRAFT_1736342 [Mycena metata]|uniref:Uncharacterized protein n=1 Tax=Mycena metata TaxID=1033252 RepID=A0AAD7HP49_9AGAR|nr:hypothetical protein B0H16DRAFT_1736342 [Mycena metata]
MSLRALYRRARSSWTFSLPIVGLEAPVHPSPAIGQLLTDSFGTSDECGHFVPASASASAESLQFVSIEDGRSSTLNHSSPSLDSPNFALHFNAPLRWSFSQHSSDVVGVSQKCPPPLVHSVSSPRVVDPVEAFSDISTLSKYGRSNVVFPADIQGSRWRFPLRLHSVPEPPHVLAYSRPSSAFFKHLFRPSPPRSVVNFPEQYELGDEMVFIDVYHTARDCPPYFAVSSIPWRIIRSGVVLKCSGKLTGAWKVHAVQVPTPGLGWAYVECYEVVTLERTVIRVDAKFVVGSSGRVLVSLRGFVFYVL